MHQKIDQLQKQLDAALAEIGQLHARLSIPSKGNELWRVSRSEVQVLGELERGTWGSVAKGRFCGQLVAVKCPDEFEAVLNPHTIDRLQREVEIMATVRHPNLLRLIAAVFDDQTPPLIITELLEMNLRTAYESGKLSHSNKLPIFRDVAYALHYLHDRHEPIVHGDVCAPNVLLEALPNGVWRGKLSDFSFANLALLSQDEDTTTSVYTAPESVPQLSTDPVASLLPQTTKVDVYSYGVFLCEVITCQLPTPTSYPNMLQLVQSQWPSLRGLIVFCTNPNPSDRPTMAKVLDELNNIPRPHPH